MSAARTVAIQNVRAVDGFAYGVIGADLHIFGDGRPVYLLEGHRAPLALDHGWLRSLPSRMLNARTQVVPFTGRQSELDDLFAWLRDRPQLAVRWLHAPGGQGKSRLAGQIAADAAAQGWRVAAAVQGVADARPSPGSVDLRPAGHCGVLLIVDYADRWSVNHLIWLFRNSLLHQSHVPVRVLLLGRTTIGWPALRATLEHPQTAAATSEQALAPLTVGDGARMATFTAARNSFAAIYGLSDPTAITPPAELNRPEFGLTLTLLVAALVAVDANATNAPSPTAPDQLTRYLLDREQLHWQHLYESCAAQLDYQIPPSVMARTVFTAVLTGPLSYSDAAALLNEVEHELPAERILNDHTRCYPPDPGGNRVLEPVYPDRLAEDFLALCLAGQVSRPSDDAWASTRLCQLLDNAPRQPTRRLWWQRRRETPQTASPFTAHAITVLTATAARWPNLGPIHLYPLLLARPQLAIAAGGATIAALADLPNIDSDVLEAVEALLPSYSNVDFDIAASAISVFLTRHRLTSTIDPVERAELLVDHAERMANAGRYEHALKPALDAVAIYRPLALTKLDDTNSLSWLDELRAVTNELAKALQLSGLSLASLSRHAEAQVQLEEAVRMCRVVDALKSDRTTRAVLAGSLDAHAASLSVLGRHDEAQDLVAEAVHIRVKLIRRRLLTNWITRFSQLDNAYTRLIESANTLGYCGRRLADKNLYEEALDSTTAAVQLYRYLAEKDPGAFLPDLAATLQDLGQFLREVGRHDEAIASTAESIAIWRRVVDASPARYRPVLIASLCNLGRLLSTVDRHDEAFASAEEAVMVYQLLAERNSAAILPYLTDSLADLSSLLLDLGNAEKAIILAEETVASNRRLAIIDPDMHLPNLARSLQILARAQFGGRNDLNKALTTVENALEILMHQVLNHPSSYGADIQATNELKADILVFLGRGDEAAGLRQKSDNVD